MFLFTDPLQAELMAHDNIYNEGDKLTLRCITASYTPVTVQWMKDEQDMSLNSNVIITGM